MENGTTVGMNYGTRTNTYQNGIREFYDSFGPDRESVEFVTPSVGEARTSSNGRLENFQNNTVQNHSITALVDDEDEEDDDDLDVDELDLDEDEEIAEDTEDEDVSDDELEEDLDITDEDEDDDDDIL